MLLIADHLINNVLHVLHLAAMHFVALLPITSRGSTSTQLITNIQRLTQRLHSPQHPIRHKLSVLVSVDYDDTAFVLDDNVQRNSALSTAPDTLSPDRNTSLLHTLVDMIRQAGVQVTVSTLHVASGAVCHIWRLLALVAFNDLHCDYTVLLGDDVELLDGEPGEWMEVAHNAFFELHHRAGSQLPFGFGCVASLPSQSCIAHTCCTTRICSATSLSTNMPTHGCGTCTAVGA